MHKDVAEKLHFLIYFVTEALIRWQGWANKELACCEVKGPRSVAVNSIMLNQYHVDFGANGGSAHGWAARTQLATFIINFWLSKISSSDVNEIGTINWASVEQCVVRVVCGTGSPCLCTPFFVRSCYYLPLSASPDPDSPYKSLLKAQSIEFSSFWAIPGPQKSIDVQQDDTPYYMDFGQAGRVITFPDPLTSFGDLTPRRKYATISLKRNGQWPHSASNVVSCRDVPLKNSVNLSTTTAMPSTRANGRLWLRCVGRALSVLACVCVWVCVCGCIDQNKAGNLRRKRWHTGQSYYNVRSYYNEDNHINERLQVWWASRHIGIYYVLLHQ